MSRLPPTVAFEHDEINDIDSFRGYEIYYKFYDLTSAFSADRSAIEAATPGSVLSTLESRGYLRAYAEGSSAPPALGITAAERDEAFTVSIVLPASDASSAEATASWNTEGARTVVLLRDQDALGDPTEPLGFSPSDINAGDADTPDPLPPGNSVDMGLAVVAYGIDYITGTFAEIYSSAIVADQLLAVSYQ